MKTPVCLAAAAITFAIAPAHAQDQTDLGIEGRYVGETLFTSIDLSGTGHVHMGDLETFRASVFAGMDYDDNGSVTYEEFSAWDPGFADVADKIGRKDAFTTATRIVFAFWDRNGDKALSTREMRLAMSADFRRADIDDDALLSKAEFINGFPIMVAMRAAIRPDL